MFGFPMYDTQRRSVAKPRERKAREDREHIEATALMQRVRAHERRWPCLRLLFAVPNGGARSKKAGAKLKAEGVRRGVPDYLLPVPAGKAVGLAVELKAKGGRLAPEQRDWLESLQEHGWQCVVAYGADEAWEAIRAYAAAHEGARS